MTQVFDEAGNLVPVSVIEAGPCFVTQLKTAEKDGYNAIQVGFGKAKKINKALKGPLKEVNAKYLREIKVDNLGEYKVGQEIKATILNPGDTVAVTGISIGKGFQGTVKRHNHGRGPMTHGSKSHRIPGSIGAGTTPGRVWKGRPMPGHMGSVKVTVPSLRVVQVDAEKNLVLLSGGVPGKKGNLLMIKRTAAAKPAEKKQEKAPAEKGKK